LINIFGKSQHLIFFISPSPGFIKACLRRISVAQSRDPGPPIRRRNQSDPIGSRRPMKSDRIPGGGIRPELKRRICFEFRQYPTIGADFYMRKKNREKS